MSEDKQEIRIVPEGCPFCNGEVRGNEKIRFYCKNCNVLLMV